MNIAFELWITSYNIAYLFDKTPYYRPWLAWMDVDLRRAAPTQLVYFSLFKFTITYSDFRRRPSPRFTLQHGCDSRIFWLPLHASSLTRSKFSYHCLYSFSSSWSGGTHLHPPLVRSPPRRLDLQSLLHKCCDRIRTV